MADGFDVHTPSPDDGHEAIRLAVVQAIEDIGWNTSDVGTTLDLADTLFVLLDGALTEIADLRGRIELLEDPPTEEEAAP